jgi:predicted nucleotidyltransferase
MNAMAVQPLEEVVRARRSEILRIAAAHGARNVRVFGSVARGQARPNSDLDLLVDLEAGRSLLDVAGLSLDLEDALACPVDVMTPEGLRPSIREHVLSEAIPL